MGYVNDYKNCFHQIRKTTSKLGELLTEKCLQCGTNINHPNVRTTEENLIVIGEKL